MGSTDGTPAPRPRRGPHGSVVLHISCRRDTFEPDQMVARAYKGWWGGPGVGGRQRTIAESWVSVVGMSEGEAIRAALADLSLALVDELA